MSHYDAALAWERSLCRFLKKYWSHRGRCLLAVSIADDGWAIASHIALSTLMALFPFFLVLTALAGIFGSSDLADEAASLVLEAWPEEVAGPIALEIHNVLVGAHGQVLTVGVVLAVYFASSGIESLRIGLNRAYSVVETRSWWLLRLESIGYVIVAAIALLALSFLVLLAPLIWAAAVAPAARARAVRRGRHLRAVRGRDSSADRPAVRRASVAAGRPARLHRDPAGNSGDA